MQIEARMFRQNSNGGVWSPEAVQGLIGQTVNTHGFDALGFTGETVTVTDAWIEDGWVLGTLSDETPQVQR